MIDKQRLEAKCSTWNIALTGTQLDQLDAFAQILVDYNQKVGDTRTLILCKKISQTPTAYPRNGGKIAKSPLK